LRLVHLAGYGGPYAGSFIPMLRAVMRAAKARGWSCETVFGPAAHGRPWLEELREDGIPFRIAPSASRRDVSALVASLLAGSGEPAILHTHFTAFDVACARAARAREATAVFWHVHTPHGNSLPLRARNLFKYGVVGRQVDGILCVSSELADVVTSRGAPRDRVVHVPNAIDADRFAPASEAERARAREELGIPAGRPALVHFGWDWHRKGGDLFCEAVARLRAAGRDVVGVTVGSPGDAQDAARRLGLPPDAFHLEESRADVRGLYAAADVFMAPSRAEGTPYSVLEAVSRGTAVVASPIPGHEEIGANAPGCRLAPLDPAALAEAAAALLDRSADQAAAESRAGHEWLRRHRHLAAWTEDLMRRYEAALPAAQ
jgi:glycosyltransferase involved in cell wall biosynthesis